MPTPRIKNSQKSSFESWHIILWFLDSPKVFLIRNFDRFEKYQFLVICESHSHPQWPKLACTWVFLCLVKFCILWKGIRVFQVIESTILGTISGGMIYSFWFSSNNTWEIYKYTLGRLICDQLIQKLSIGVWYRWC